MKYLIVIMLAVLFSCNGERKYYLVDMTNETKFLKQIDAELDAGSELQGGVCVYKDEEGLTHYTQAMTYVSTRK